MNLLAYFKQREAWPMGLTCERTMTMEGKAVYSVEWCDEQAGFPSIDRKWKELFGEPLDTSKAVSIDDQGDCITYLMPNGYRVQVASDVESIFAPEPSPVDYPTILCTTCGTEYQGICPACEEARELSQAVG